MSQLSESELNEIREEAEKEYPVTGGQTGSLQNAQMNRRTGYIAAATLYRQRSKVLVEALENVFKRDGYEFVKQALDTYIKSIKP